MIGVRRAAGAKCVERQPPVIGLARQACEKLGVSHEINVFLR